jgi:hypothetical protein
MRTKEPPELGPDDGLRPDTVAGGVAVSDSDPEEETHGTEPQDTLRDTGWSRDEENEGDSQAARDPDTTRASDAEPTPNTHEGEASDAKEEPETHNTDEPSPDGTADGSTPDRLSESRYSNEAHNGLEESADDRERTPKPTASPAEEEPVTNEHSKASSEDEKAETTPRRTLGEKEQNRRSDRPGPNNVTDADPGATAKLGDTPLTKPGCENVKADRLEEATGNKPNKAGPIGEEGLTHSKDDEETRREETGPTAPNEHGELNDREADAEAITTVPPEEDPESGAKEDTTASATDITEADPAEAPEASTLSHDEESEATDTNGTSHSCIAEDTDSEETHTDADDEVG